MFFTKSVTAKFFSFAVFILMSTFTWSQLPMQTAPVQTDFSDTELQQFVKAVQQVITIQEENQYKMMEAIEGSDLTVDRFNEMLMEGQQKGQSEITGTEGEKEAFTASLNEVQQIQQSMQMDMIQAITEEGLDVDKYQVIMQAYEQDPETKEKIDQYFAELQ